MLETFGVDMSLLPEKWRPLALDKIQDELPGFENWVLCGGYSVALWTGVDTRSHGDIDIGVFRSELAACLNVIEPERVFICMRGSHCPWDGGEVPQEVHDIWIADRTKKHWVLQIMVCDDEDERVFYRRDRRLSWAKEHHSIEAGGIRVLNPFVTLLFKANKTTLEVKEVHDVMQLIAKGSELSGPPDCDGVSRRLLAHSSSHIFATGDLRR